VLCVEFILVRATVNVVQWYCVVLEFIAVIATVDIEQWYCVVSEIIVVTATEVIVQWYCVVCGVYCGYNNSSYRAMVRCCVWSLLWLHQQWI